ncbi:MAG TPA: hypothetical protein VGB52_03005 [Actinomycetota bacterium]
MRAFIMGAALLGLITSVAPSSAAEDAVEETVLVRWVYGSRHGVAIEGSSQATVATAEGTSMVVTTSGLRPGHAYTLWFTFFNHPEYCTSIPPVPGGELRCGMTDLLNPLTDGSLVFGDGLVATGIDDTFEGYRPIDDFPEGDEQIAYGTGVLTNPLGAEYQATLRDHGLASEDPQELEAQLTTLNGGCHEGEDGFPCRDQQASGFRIQMYFECFEDVSCFTQEEGQ